SVMFSRLTQGVTSVLQELSGDERPDGDPQQDGLVPQPLSGGDSFSEGPGPSEEVLERLAQTEQLVVQLKELIREKDTQLASAEKQLKDEKEQGEAKFTKLKLQAKAKMAVLNKQISELKAQEGQNTSQTSDSSFTVPSGVEEELQQLKQKLSEEESLTRSLQEQLVVAEQRLKEKEDDHAEKVRVLQAVVQEKDVRFQEQILKHEEELLHLTSQTSNDGELQQALRESQRRIEELEESLRSRSEVLEMLQQELNSADQQKQILTTQFRQMELELAESRRLREEERQQLACSEEQLGALRASLETAEKEREQAITAVEAELARRSSELDEVKARLEAVEQEKEQSVEKEKEVEAGIEAELTNLRASLEASERQREEVTKKLEVEVESRVAELHSLQEKLDAVEKEREEALKGEREELTRLQMELANLRERLDAGRGEQEVGLQAMQALEKLWKGLHSLTGSEEESEVEMSIPADPAQVLPVLEARLDNLRVEQREREVRMSQITVTLETLQGQLDKSTAEGEEAVTRMQQLEQQLVKLQVTDESLGDQASDTSTRDLDRADIAKEALSSGDALHTEKVLALEQQLMEREKELSVLRKKLETTEQQTLKISEGGNADCGDTGNNTGMLVFSESPEVLPGLDETLEEDKTLIAVETSGMSTSVLSSTPDNESSPEITGPQSESPEELKGASSDEMVTSSDSEVAHSSWTLLEAINQDGAQEWPPQVKNFGALQLSTQSWEETSEEHVTSTCSMVEAFAQVLAEELQKRYSDLLAELQQLKDSATESQEKVDLLEEELKSQTSIKDEAEARAQKTSELEDLQQRLSLKEQEMMDLNDTMTAKLLQADKTSDESEELVTLRKEKENLAAKIDTMKKDGEQTVEEDAKQKRDVEEGATLHSTEEREREQELQKLKALLQETREVSSMESELEALQKRLQEAVDSRKDTLRKAKEKDRHHREQLRQQKEEYSGLLERFEAEDEEKAELLKRDPKTASENPERLGDWVQEDWEELKSEQAARVDLEMLLQESQTSISLKEKELDTLREKCQQAESYAEMLKAEVEEAAAVAKTSMSDTESPVAALQVEVEEFKQFLKSKNNEIVDLSQQLTEQERNQKIESEIPQKQEEDSNAKLQQLQRKLQAALVSRKEALKEKQALKEEQAAAEKIKLELQAKLENGETELSKLRAEKEKLIEELAMDGLLSEKDTYKCQSYENERQESAAKARAHEAARQEAERLAEEAQKEVDAVKDKMRKFAKAKQQKILELEEENESLREQVERKGSKELDTKLKQELEKEAEELRHQLNKDIDRKDSETLDGAEGSSLVMLKQETAGNTAKTQLTESAHKEREERLKELEHLQETTEGEQRLKEECSKKEKQLQELRTSLEAEKDDLEEQLMNQLAQRELEKKEREQAELEAMVANERDRAARLEEDKRQAQRERAEAEAETELLREKQLEVRQMQKDCIQYQERISELDKEAKALLLGRDEGEASQAIADKKASAQSAQQREAELKAEAEQTLDENDRDRVLDEAKQWESRFHSALQGKESELREAESRAKDLSEQLHKETTQKEKLQNSLESLQKAEEKWQLEMAETEKRHSEILSALEKERGELQQKLSEAESSLAQTSSQLASLEGEAEGLRHRAKALEEAVGKLQSEANQARAEIKERETEEKRLCLSLEQLETDLRSYKNLTETLQAELTEKEKREVELLGEKEQAVTKAVEEARKEADSRAEDAERQLEERRSVMRNLEENLHKAEEDASHSKARLDNFTKAMGSLQDDRDRVLIQYRQLEERHLQVMMEKDSLIQEAAAENNSLKEELRGLLAQRDDLHAENAKLAAQLHGYRDELKQVLTLKDSQHKQLLSAQLERIIVLEKEREDLQAKMEVLEKETLLRKGPPVEHEVLSQAGQVTVKQEIHDAPGAEVEKLREQLQAARKQIETLEYTLQSEREAQATDSKELKELRWEGGILRTEAETAEERVAELARDLVEMEQNLLAERETVAQLKAQNQSFGQAMASLQDSRDQAISEAEELRLRLEEGQQTGQSGAPSSSPTGEVWSLKNALSALQNDRERMVEQLQMQRSELDRLGSGELIRLTQTLENEKKKRKETEKRMSEQLKQLQRDRQELETLKVERSDWQAQAELLKQQTLATLSERDQQVRHLSAMLEEARTTGPKLLPEHTRRQGTITVDSAPGGPLEHSEDYKAECILLQRRLEEETELRLSVEEQLSAARDHLKRHTQGEWQSGVQGITSETAVLIEPPEGAITRTRSGGPGLSRMLKGAFCSRQRTPLLVSLYLLTVHVLLLLCMGGYL
ncbi:hypothetical protein NFI96_023933, partial [Prochilodus magdalenae]